VISSPRRVVEAGMDPAMAGGIARPTRSVPGGLVAAALVVCGLVGSPVVYLLIRAAEASTQSWDLILRSRTVWLALRTIGLAAAVTATAGAIGVAFAWLAVRSDLPFRRVWTVLYALPLVVPSYVGAFVLLAALGPKGLVQGWLEPLGVERLPDIGGFPGAYLALSLFTYPYAYLVAAAAIRGLDPSLEETARTLGRPRWEVFRRVTLPLLRPAIAAGGLLVALYTLHDFGAVSLMRFPTFTQAIYLQYRAAFDRTPAAILSLMLIAIALAVVAAEQRFRSRARYYRTGAGAARDLPAVALGRWRWGALALSGAVVGLALVLPVGVLLYLLVRGLDAGIAFNLTAGAAGNSVLVSSAGAAAAALLALPVAALAARYPGRGADSVERVAYAGYALPGLVVALSLVFFASRYATVVYQSLPLVIVAYVVLFLPQVAEPLKSGLLQLSPRVEEAGRTLGRGPGAVFRRVALPLLARPAAAGMALVFLTAMKELPATLLLRPTGFETLATRIWTSASAGLYSRASVPAMLIVLVSIVPLSALARRVGVEEIRGD
jgi:iron(III) transport system permease protein